MERRRRLQAEIERDARVTAAGFAHELVRAAVTTLERAALSEAPVDTLALFEQVDALLARFRAHHRDLNDARIVRRAERSQHEPDPSVPPAARPFAYHGTYFGAFPDLETFARDAVASVRAPNQYLDLLRVALDLHLRGEFWTVEQGGVVHAFAPARQEPRDSDAARARELLVARGDDPAAIEAAMATYAGRFSSTTEFARRHVFKMRVPMWLLMHVDFATLAYQWAIEGSIWPIHDPEGEVHVFVRRDPRLEWP